MSIFVSTFAVDKQKGEIMYNPLIITPPCRNTFLCEASVRAEWSVFSRMKTS